MNNVVDIFATDIEKEARALLDFMDSGDLNIELLRLQAELSGNSTEERYPIRELLLEQIEIVELAFKLLRLKK